ncbi:MAG: glycosyl transferase [Sphingobacteriales bacterium]|uniref:hypothetical protein n=1 Tax=Hydrotalea flava TaxID=714549 RepID=UPI000830F3A3|nr:hypothetical protein [Hydrotalea flava]RTL49089.1 MAG: glycosyl transferase [Sphingobacteriales bacterium]
MTLFFTLCSKNYIAQAITLQQSLKEIHPNIDFVIGIVDQLNNVEKNKLKNYSFLEVDDLEINVFNNMKLKYNVIELNTAVKPYYIHYFFRKGFQKIIYFDPDIFVYISLNSIIQQLDEYSFILTPHFSTPIYDNFLLSEQIVLGTGIFNLGFLAIKNDTTGNALIMWWQKKLLDECILDLSRGYFVDQKWMNLSICHFDNYLINKNKGLNVAHWNLHERNVSFKDGQYWINDTVPLIFFHFSSYSPDQPNKIANWQNRFTFETRPDIAPLFQQYGEKVLTNNYIFWKQCKPVYGKKLHKNKSMKHRIQYKLIHWIQSI